MKNNTRTLKNVASCGFDGEHEIVDAIEIDLSAIPRHVVDRLSAALLSAANRFYSDQANCAARDAWKAERETRGDTKR